MKTLYSWNCFDATIVSTTETLKMQNHSLADKYHEAAQRRNPDHVHTLPQKPASPEKKEAVAERIAGNVITARVT